MDGKLPLRPGTSICMTMLKPVETPQPYTYIPCHAVQSACCCFAAVTHFIRCQKRKVCNACMTLLCGKCRAGSICLRVWRQFSNHLFALCHSITICNAASGITEFIDIALDKGAAIGLLAGTCSIPEEQILTAALFALGEDRTQQLHTFTCSLRQNSTDHDSLPQDSYEGLTLEQSIAAARARVNAHASTLCTSIVCAMCSAWLTQASQCVGHVINPA